MKKQKKVKKQKNILPVLLVMLLIVSAAAIYSNAKYGTSLSASSSKKINNNNTSVWEVLKARGLQGEHYTLNIHGKKDGFTKQDCTTDGGNNVFMPSNSSGSNTDNQILMSSGNAKGKWASTNVEYGVSDSCTNAFDGDPAELTLPANENGYFVTARVLGKPTNNPELNIEGELVWVNDEHGNDLLVLGLVTDNGFQTPSTLLTRTKGKTKAVDITGVFEWNGSVCYFDPTNYCYDELGQYTCNDQNMCCIPSGEGTYDGCVDTQLDADGIEFCTDPYQLVSLACQDYMNEWVFNIGDFVGYMWNTHSDGDFKLANIRFYPVP